MKLPKRRKRPAPIWVRRVERLLAPPGWVQVQALTSVAPDKNDLHAAAMVGPDRMYAFTNPDGEPALTLALDIGEGWQFEGVVVRAEKAYAAGLITAKELARAMRCWT